MNHGNSVNGVMEHIDEYGFDVNGKGDHGRTILHVVARSGHLANVGRILDVPGVDVNSQDEDGKTPLHLAIFKGHKEIVEKLLGVSSTDVNLKDKEGAYTLHWAAKLGYGAIVEKILKEKNGDVNCTDDTGMTPLHWVAKITTCNSDDRSDHMAVVEKILAAPNVDANRRDHNEISPFMMAIMHKQYAIAEKILKALGGGFVNSREHDGESPLHWAATTGKVSVVKMIWEISGVDVNCQDIFHMTPLHWAARKGHHDVVAMFLERAGVFMDCKDNVGLTPLHWASMSGHHTVVRTLSSKVPNVDVNSKDHDGKTPLHLAVEEGHEAVVEEIMKVPGVDLVNEDFEKLSPLHKGIKTNNEAIVQMFLNALGKDHFMNERLENDKTLMHMAAMCGHVAMVNKLRVSGVDVSLKDASGMTPLHCASEGGHAVVVETLLEEPSVDVNCQNRDGKTPLHLAVSSGHEATVLKILKAENVDVNCVDVNNQTPLHYAVDEQELKILSILLKEKEIRLVEDCKGKTALQYAFEEEDKQNFVKYLSESSIGKAYEEGLFRDRQVYVDASNAILVGAALIAGVTFASWLQPPLGYSTFYEQVLTNPYPGPPTSYPEYVDFEHHKSLQAFWIFNSLSFFFSTSTVVFGARSVLPMRSIFIQKAVSKIRLNLLITAGLLFFSILFGIISFSIAGYIVIPPKLKFQANIFSTVAVGGSVCLVSLYFLARSIVEELKPLLKFQRYGRKVML